MTFLDFSTGTALGRERELDTDKDCVGCSATMLLWLAGLQEPAPTCPQCGCAREVWLTPGSVPGVRIVLTR
jgi:hypothetical protein